MPRTAESHRLRVEALTSPSFAASFLCLADNIDFYSPSYREALFREAARRVHPAYVETHYPAGRGLIRAAMR